jgi:hypothetical protein
MRSTPRLSQLFIGTHNELAPNGDASAEALWGEFARQSANIRGVELAILQRFR